MTSMQFGVMNNGYLDQDPPGVGPVVHPQRTIKEWAQLAVHAEAVGLDVIAIGEHHNLPFWSSSPTTALAYIAAQTTTLLLSTSITLITTNDPVRIAEEYAVLQHLSDGRADLVLGRGNTTEVYPWFGQDVRQGIPLAIENYALLHRLWHEEVVNWEGSFRTPLNGFTSIPRPLDGVPPFVWHGSIRSPEIAEQAAFYGDGFFANNLFHPAGHFERLVQLYRERFAHYGHGRPDQAVVGLGGHIFVRPRSQDAIEEFRPHFANSFGRQNSVEDYMRSTTMTVGSPEQIIDRYAGMRELFGDYQRQMFVINLPGMTQKTSLEQLDALGDLLPALRKELDHGRPEGAADAPTHAARVAERSVPIGR